MLRFQKFILIFSIIFFIFISIPSFSYAFNLNFNFSLFKEITEFILKVFSKLKAQIFEPEVSLEKQGFAYILNGNPSGIERFGNYVYMVLNETVKSPLVYDISQPEKPKLVEMVSAQGWPTRVRMVEGTNWLWVVHGNTWAFYDLSNPAKPRLAEANEGPNIKFIPRGNDNPPTTFKQHPNLTYTSVANANTLFYGRESSGNLWIEIYDISTPTSPKFLSKIENATPRKLRGNLLFAFGTPPTSSRIQIYDVSNPSNPRLISKIDDVPDNIKNLGFGFDDHIDYDSERKIMTIGIKKSTPKPYWGANLTDSRMGGTVSGIAVYDVSDWNSPRLLGFGYYGAGDKERLINMDEHVYSNGFVYGADILGYLVVFDVRDPQNIKLIYEDKQGGERCASAVVPDRNLVLITGTLWSSSGFHIVDTSDPTNPKVTGHVSHIGMQWASTFGVYKSRYAYFPVGARYIGSPLYIVDFQDPYNPKIVNVLWNYGGYTDTLVIDDYLYHGYGYIFYLKDDPINPRKLDKTLPTGGATALFYKEPYIFAVNPYNSSTLNIIDISKREDPVLVSSVKFSSADHRVTSITSIGNYVFVAGNSVRAVDISDIKNPKIVGEWGSKDIPILAEQKQVWSDGKYLYIGTYHSEITAFDVSTIPTQGKPTMVYKLTGLPTAWTINGEKERGLIYRIALYGLQIIKINYRSQPRDTIPPPSPENARAELTDTAIKISWDPVSVEDLRDYKIYKSTNNSPFTLLTTVSSSTREYIDTDTKASSTYSYKISARDINFNESRLSSPTEPIHIPLPPENKPPITEDINITIDEDTEVSIELKATDPENAPLEFRIVKKPKLGEVLFISSTTVKYKPKPNAFGLDEFTYVAYDGQNFSKEAFVRIQINPVNDPPEPPTILKPSNNSKILSNNFILILYSNDIDSKKIKYEISIFSSTSKYLFESPYVQPGEKLYYPIKISNPLENPGKIEVIAIDEEGAKSLPSSISVEFDSKANKPPKTPRLIFPRQLFIRLPFLLIILQTEDEDDNELFYNIEIYRGNAKVVDYKQITKSGETFIFSLKENSYLPQERAYFASFLMPGVYKIKVTVSDGKSESSPLEFIIRIIWK